jgi:CheY-like chemotaxis protein
MEKKKILVVEDDRSMARLMEVLLGNRGLKAHLCLDATHAVEMARRLHPDLIILDIHMPRLSGIRVLKRLRRDSSTADIPVVISSVLSRRKSIEQLEKLGADAFVPKSAGVEALLDKVISLLSS